jgi:hypothetical protein
MQVRHWYKTAVGVIAAITSVGHLDSARAQPAGTEMLDPALRVRTVVSGLELPIAMAFLDDDDLLVLD